MALADDSYSLDDPALAVIDRLALFMGTEGDGLSLRTIDGCDLTGHASPWRAVWIPST